MFGYLEELIVEAAEDLENSHSYYQGNNSYTRLMMIHQGCNQRTRYYSTVMLQDLQARGGDPTYNYVLHFYVQE